MRPAAGFSGLESLRSQETQSRTASRPVPTTGQMRVVYVTSYQRPGWNPLASQT